MENTFVKTGSLARLSGDIDDLFNELEKNAASPAPVVPTPPGSQRLQVHLAPAGTGKTLHYQPVINSVFKIPFSPDAEFKTLCQDCLRVVCHPTREAMNMAHDEFFFCDCGGSLCSCKECFEEADLLARNGSAAIVELARLCLIKPITGPFIYSPATGIVREQSK